MADSGIFRINPLQGWQREAILKAAAFLRKKYGTPPSDAAARDAYDGLLEVLDPARRTLRLQREISEATRNVAATIQKYARARVRQRRAQERRKANLGPPSGADERRNAERRARERRQRR